MKVDAFDFDLPDGCIALRPVEPRDAARMMVVRPDASERFVDSAVSALTDWLKPGDVLVLNDTRVIPARLFGERLREGATGAKVECLLHQRLDDSRWQAFARPAKRLKPGDVIRFAGNGAACYADTLNARIETVEAGGIVTLGFEMTGPFLDSLIATHGEMPLPPYIAGKRATDGRDAADYQTVYARHDGAVAAPTAGLHFTNELLERLKHAGIEICHVTLHVGAGTFLPVKAADTQDHAMHAEWGEICEATAQRINAARGSGGRIVAAGTTSLRLVESAAREDGSLAAFSAATDIFITPGYRFKAVDVVLTNFHLPRSTLFMLVSAFCGLETMQDAYAHAIAGGYRFYSYGDCCLLHAQRA